MPTLYFSPKDAYSVMNTLAREVTGQSSIAVVDTSTFVSAGKSVLEAGYENVYNALGVLISRTIIAARPYEGKFKIIAEDNDAFDNRFRKISFYARDNEASGAFNTNVYTNLGAGLDDESGAGSMWDQNPAIPTERYFFSDMVWMKSHTTYWEQAKQAFTDERSFIDFINGIMIEVQNDIETTLEAKNRMVVLDRIAGTKLLSDRGEIGSECAVNLTKEFNAAHGTAYTSAQLMNDHTVAFLEFFLARIKNDSDMLTNRTAMFHDPMQKTISDVPYHVLRHTPKEYQKMIYNSRFFTQINLSLAEIFNPGMLALPNGEGCQYWQSAKSPYAIDIKPALPEGNTSSEVKIDNVIAILFDRDGLMVNNKFTGMYTSQLNPKHLYTNSFWHYKYGICNDYSENAIIYYMSDESTEYFEGDGTTVAFELEGTATSIVSVTVNGTAKTAGTDFTFATNTVTFASAPADDAIIQIIYK